MRSSVPLRSLFMCCLLKQKRSRYSEGPKALARDPHLIFAVVFQPPCDINRQFHYSNSFDPHMMVSGLALNAQNVQLFCTLAGLATTFVRMVCNRASSVDVPNKLASNLETQQVLPKSLESRRPSPANLLSSGF